MPGDSLRDLHHLADAMRQYHSAWLTHALQRGVHPPRIPVRKVDDAGWTALVQTPEGRAWAEEFWQGALAHPDAG